MARSLVPLIFDVALPGQRGGTDPFMQLHREMNRLFDDVARGGVSSGVGRTVAPRMNVSETDNEVHIEAELPGIPESDVHVELSDDMLTIRGEKQSQRENAQHHVAERVFGTFARTVRLPFAPKPEAVQAKFENGVLHIVVPKSAPEARRHRIAIRGGAAQPVGSGAQAATEASAATAGHPTQDTTLHNPPDPNPTYLGEPAKNASEAAAMSEEGPGHAT